MRTNISKSNLPFSTDSTCMLYLSFLKTSVPPWQFKSAHMLYPMGVLPLLLTSDSIPDPSIILPAPYSIRCFGFPLNISVTTLCPVDDLLSEMAT